MTKLKLSVLFISIFTIGICSFFLKPFTVFAETPALSEENGGYYYTVSDENAVITGYRPSIVSDKLIIPSSICGYPVTVIGDYAFSGGTFTEIYIPDSVKVIGSNAFMCCDACSCITIGNGVKSIYNAAFSYCTGLKSINIPDSVTFIGEFAFFECGSLTDVTLGNGITNICASLFSGCYSLENINIPDSLTEIDENAFSDCVNLTSISIGEDNSEFELIDGVLYTKDSTVLVVALKNIKTVCIPSSVRKICDAAFMYCGNIKELSIPNTVTYIGKSVFRECKNLKTAVIGSGIEKVEMYAFTDCDFLTSVTVVSGVTEFDCCVFMN